MGRLSTTECTYLPTSVCCAACAVSGAACCRSQVCWLGVLCCVCGVWRRWLPFTSVLARCAVLCVRCPAPLPAVHRCACSVCCAVSAVSGSAGCRSPVCPLDVLCCLCGIWRRWLPCTVLLARCAACVVSSAAGCRAPVCPFSVLCCMCGVLGRWLPFTGVLAWCAVLRVRCLAPLAAVHRCARSVCCAVYAASDAAGCRSPVCSLGVLCCVCGVRRRWLLYIGVLARCAVPCVWCPAPLAAVHRCARSVCCAVSAVSCTASCRSPVCPFGVLCCVCGIRRCRLLLTGVLARCAVLRVRCPAPLAAVHRCAPLVCCAACAVSGAAGCRSPVCPLLVLCCVCGVRRRWLPFTGVPAPCAVLCVRCPAPLAAVHRCACSVCCAACAVSGAAGRCSPVCPLGVLCCVCGVWRRWLPFTGVLLGVLCCVCDVRRRWLPFTGVLPRSAVLRVRCLARLGAVHRCAHSACCAVFSVSGAAACRSAPCSLGVLCCVCGVLRGWLPFTGVPARCAVLDVRCLAPLAAGLRYARSVSCAACGVSGATGCRSPVCSLGVPKALLPNGKGRDVYQQIQVNGLGCVCCVRAVCKCVVA